MIEDGAVELYHNGANKFETFSSGVKINGNLVGVDNKKIQLGNDNDLQIYHNGSHSYALNSTGQFIIGGDTVLIKDAGNSEVGLKYVKDGAVELYHNDSKKFETTSTGCKSIGVLAFDDSDGNNNMIRLGGGADLQLYHNGTNNYIDVATTGQDLFFRTSVSGSGDTSSMTVRSDGSITHPDNIKTKWGASDDLQIYHDGSHSKLVNSTGELHLASNNAVKILGGSDLSEVQAVFNDNGVVDLYCDNVVKFSTHANGAQLHGDSLLRHDGWRGLLDRSWDDYPSISISPDTTYGNQTELRIHGDSASNLGYLGGGANFALDVRCDGSYENGSDRRRKTNIEEITGALATVKQLTGKKFNIINRQGDLDPNRGTRKQFGLIAQECEDIIPEVVKFHPDENTPNENGWCSAYGLDYGQLTPLLINAVKELSAEVDTLKTKVAALEAA